MNDKQKRIKERYEGLQDLLISCGEGGCHFLMCCSIIEEVNGKDLDLINAIRYVTEKKLFTKDFTGKDCIPFLEHFTSKKWRRSELLSSLPAVIHDNQFTEIKYHNNRTEYDHFTRRYVDPKINSVTVAEGKIVGYYTYTWS